MVIDKHRKEKDSQFLKPMSSINGGTSKVILAPLSDSPLERLRTSTRGKDIFDDKLSHKNIPDKVKFKIVNIGTKLHERLDFKESKPEK